MTLYFVYSQQNAYDIITLSTPWRTGHRLRLFQTTASMQCSGVLSTCRRKGTLDQGKNGAKHVMVWKYLTISRKCFMFYLITNILHTTCSWNVFIKGAFKCFGRCIGLRGVPTFGLSAYKMTFR